MAFARVVDDRTQMQLPRMPAQSVRPDPVENSPVENKFSSPEPALSVLRNTRQADRTRCHRYHDDGQRWHSPPNKCGLRLAAKSMLTTCCTDILCSIVSNANQPVLLIRDSDVSRGNDQNRG